MKPCITAFLGLLCIGLNLCKSENILLGSGEPVQHFEYEGRAKWRLIPYLWYDKSVNVTCPFTKVCTPRPDMQLKLS